MSAATCGRQNLQSKLRYFPGKFLREKLRYFPGKFLREKVLMGQNLIDPANIFGVFLAPHSDTVVHTHILDTFAFSVVTQMLFWGL
jgi:hypothetical protein